MLADFQNTGLLYNCRRDCRKRRKCKSNRRLKLIYHQTLDEIDDNFSARNGNAVDVLSLDDALKRLAALDAQQAKIVELKFFVGLTNEDAGKVLGISVSTVKREWRMAKARLSTQLT